MIKSQLLVILYLFFFTDSFGQNDYCLNNYCDTVYLREFSTKSNILQLKLDTLLDDVRISKLDDDEVYYINVSRVRYVNELVSLDPKADYYTSISKVKKTSDILFVNKTIGYYKYKEMIFFLSIDHCIHELFEPMGNQKKFILYSLKKLYPILDFLKLGVLRRVSDSYNYKIINNKWYFEWGFIVTDKGQQD